MEDLSARTLRELMTLARERFGPGAASLKTKAELIAALSEAPTASEAPPVEVVAPRARPEPVFELVTSDFFRRRS